MAALLAGYDCLLRALPRYPLRSVVPEPSELELTFELGKDERVRRELGGLDKWVLAKDGGAFPTRAAEWR